MGGPPILDRLYLGNIPKQLETRRKGDYALYRECRYDPDDKVIAWDFKFELDFDLLQMYVAAVTLTEPPLAREIVNGINPELYQKKNKGLVVVAFTPQDFMTLIEKLGLKEACEKRETELHPVRINLRTA